MATDWSAARRLESLVDNRRLPEYAREAMREAAELIRMLDEELSVRNAIITRLHAGQGHPSSPEQFSEIRREYHRDLQAIRDRSQ